MDQTEDGRQSVFRGNRVLLPREQWCNGRRRSGRVRACKKIPVTVLRCVDDIENASRRYSIHISMDELKDRMDQVTSAARSQDQHLSNKWGKIKQKTP